MHVYSACLYSISGVKTIHMKCSTKTLICVFEFKHFMQIWTKQHIFSYMYLEILVYIMMYSWQWVMIYHYGHTDLDCQWWKILGATKSTIAGKKTLTFFF